MTLAFCSSASEIFGPRQSRSSLRAQASTLLPRRPVVARKTEAVRLWGTKCKNIAVLRHRLFFLLDSLPLRIYGLYCSIDQLTGSTIYRSMLVYPTKKLIPNSPATASIFHRSPLRAILSIPVVCRSSMYGFGRRNVSANSYPSCYGTRWPSFDRWLFV